MFINSRHFFYSIDLEGTLFASVPCMLSLRNFYYSGTYPSNVSLLNANCSHASYICFSSMGIELIKFLKIESLDKFKHINFYLNEASFQVYLAVA